MTTIFLAEFIGTFVLMFMGNSVGSNVSFKSNKGAKSGYYMAMIGWALAVLFGVMAAKAVKSDAGHINPAITMMFLVKGDITFAQSLVFIASQLLGAMVAQIFVIIFYYQSMKESDLETILGVHSTIPTHKKAWKSNALVEFVATIVLATFVLWIFSNTNNSEWFWAMPIPVALLVLSIGVSLGGPTGFAINPARDLGPRIIYYLVFGLLPKVTILKNNFTLFQVVNKEKANPQWSYSWIPVVMPLAAGVTVGAFSYI